MININKNLNVKRALSYEDIVIDKERNKPPKYKGRQSLQPRQSKDKKYKSKDSKNRKSAAEYEDEYFNATCLDILPPIKKHSSNLSEKSKPEIIISDSSTTLSKKFSSPELEEIRLKLEKIVNDTEKDKDIKEGPMGCIIIHDQCYKYGDALWLTLSSFFANRSMTPNHIHKSIAAQNSWILKMREEKRHILKDIEEFKLDLISEPENLNWLHAIYHPTIVKNIKNASQKVSNLMREYEAFVELYPTYSSMIKNEPTFNTEIERRIKLLYMWENTLNELFAKIKEIKDYFEVITDVRRKRRSSVSISSPTSPESPVFKEILWPKYPNTTCSNDINSLEYFNAQAYAEKISTMYANVVGRSLRLRGMTVVLERIKAICDRTLEKAVIPLHIPKLYAQVASCPAPRVFQNVCPQEKKEMSELTVNNKSFKDMNLPSFYHHYAFLLRIPVDLVHQWLKMRSEKVICKRWDLLTLNTLIEDSHDCLSAAIGVKNKYMDHVSRTTFNPIQQQQYLEQFDCKLDVVFQNYLGYIRHWTQTATSNVNVDVEWCDTVLSLLRSEWYRAKLHAKSVTRGEAATAQLFCNVGKDLMTQIVRNYLMEKLDAAGKELIDKDVDEDDELISLDEDEEEGLSSSVFVLCREFREIFRQLRERAVRGLLFLKLLSCDLELCAKYSISSDIGTDLVRILTASDHVILNFINYENCPFIVMCTREIVNNLDFIDSLLNCTCGNLTEDPPTLLSTINNNENYLILIPTNIIDKKNLINIKSNGSSMSLSLKTKTTLEHYITPTCDIYLISENRKQLENCRKIFEKCIYIFIEKQLIKLSDDFCSCNDQISQEVVDLKEIILDTSNEIWNCAQEMEKMILNGKNVNDISEKEKSTLKATLKQVYNVAFEFDRELTRHVSMPKHPEFAERAAKNACIWANYVIRASQEDITITSRWASIPLQCFNILTSNRVVGYLKPETLDMMTKTLSLCLDHISSPKMRPSTSASSMRKTFDDDEDFTQYDLSSGLCGKRVTVQEKIKQTAEYVDRCRQSYLEENRKVGRIVPVGEVPFESHFLRSKRAPFEWQRLENKILGTGSFGICYLVMNLRDKFLMAMKQVKVCRENNDNLKALIDEVDIFRQLDHQNLVKYYGIEVHKDEVLIFMEYCSGGTLAKVCREGLELGCVRRYTNFLLKAVDYLHKKQIVHRDIKPANIFLTQQDILKLGDFGCSVRIRDPTTRYGEVIAYVGTINYQAPELQTNTLAGSEIPTNGIKVVGYGRAVDIWSSGCVVLEMLTGKPPYHQLNHELQIIYQLGSGIPPKLTPEIENNSMIFEFLKKCFTIDPSLRPTAAELLQDTFVNIDTNAYELR